jgi:hypothetical protein
MPHINSQGKEIAFKIVYFGPGMSGKTTNLAFVHRSLKDLGRGDMVVLDTAGERTLFFDFFPMELGRIAGYALHFNMYTVPGQIQYEASRRLILEGADGVIFVADSNSDRWNENLASYRMLEENLHSHGEDPRRFPMTLQYNKRDCSDPIAVGALERALDLPDMPVLEAVAYAGMGVMETIRIASRQVVERFHL